MSAVCTACGRTVAIRKDGNLRIHGYEMDPVTGYNTQPGVRCDGSGRPPRDAT